MRKPNPHVLYERLQQAQERSINEFTRYVDMSISGLSHGRRYSEQAIEKQKKVADEAENEAKEAQRRFDEATERPTDQACNLSVPASR